MKPITFSREETRAMVDEIRDYFRDELDQDIGAMPSKMLVRFFAERMGHISTIAACTTRRN